MRDEICPACGWRTLIVEVNKEENKKVGRCYNKSCKDYDIIKELTIKEQKQRRTII